MEIRYLRCFSAVAELRNFTRAAEQLHVAQPAISQQIRALEDELGVTLLSRTNRSVKLTAAGQAFLAETKEILERIDKSLLIARRAAQGEIGSLSIGCFSAASSLFLPKLIQDYRKRFPLVRIHLHELTAGPQIEAFERGRIDVGFTRPLPINIADQFVQQHVYRDSLVAVVPDCHALAGRRNLALEDLAGEDWVLFKRSDTPAVVDAMIGLCEASGFAPQLVAEAGTMQSLLMMVASGVGVSLVPRCTRSIGQPGVSFIPPEKAGPPIDLVSVREKGEPIPTVAAFLDLLADHLPEIQKTYEVYEVAD